MYFKDRTFCYFSDICKNEKCNRLLTDKLKEESEAEKLYVSYAEEFKTDECGFIPKKVKDGIK